ncbi:MAG: transporter substrate-binding domain-containing protein [Anaerolineae bacterium]|nr:transporter substrate-binding domain-containing protein [Anaerolineae bacterium]
MRADLAEEVQTPEDLVGLRVGVQLGTTGDEFASEIDGVEVVRFDEITLAFQALGESEIDAIINDGPTSADIIANNPDLEAVIVGEPLTDEFYGIAVNPELTDLLDTLNVSLANVIASGEYAEIFMEWFDTEPPAMFMPMDEDMGMMEVDFSTPEGVVMGWVSTVFSEPAPEDLLAFVCEEDTETPCSLTNRPMASLVGLAADVSGLELEVEEADGVATVIPGGQIVLISGDTETPLPVNVLLSQVGITDVTLVEQEDGTWLICSVAE